MLNRTDRPDDVWWPVEQTWANGQNETWPYYFVVVPGGASLTGGEPRQDVFSVIRALSSFLYALALVSC
jgi:hypothetical protein